MTSKLWILKNYNPQAQLFLQKELGGFYHSHNYYWEDVSTGGGARVLRLSRRASKTRARSR